MKRKWFSAAVILIGIGSLAVALPPSDVRVAPLLSTEWGQTTVNGNACFNYFTPDSGGYPSTPGSAANYPAGCAATAMAQLMNFHQWAIPQYPYGTSFTIYADGTAYSASIMGGALGNYDWLLMEQIAFNGSARQEVGALLHDLGAALGMDYWASGSGTDFDYIDNVFVGFTYSNAVTIEGNFVSGGVLLPQSINAALAELAIMTNLDAGLPVLIGVNDTSLQSGHVLVIDGYGYDTFGTAYFHYNFGMPVLGVTPPATNLGWFTLPGVGTTNDSAGYNVLDGVAFNIFKPFPTPATGEIISGRVTDKAGAALEGIQVDITSVNPMFLPVTVFTNAQGIFAAYGSIASNQQYTVAAHDIGYAAASRLCSVGISAKQWIPASAPGDGYYYNTVGNVQIALALAERIPIPTGLPICDMDEFAGFSRCWNTTHSEITDPNIRYDYTGDWRVDMRDLHRLTAAWMVRPPEFRTELDVHFGPTGPLPSELPWLYEGDGGAWSVVASPMPAAESPAISHSQFTSVKLPVKVLPGSSGILDITFQFECDTEPFADVFEFLLDGAVQTEMGGQPAFSGNMPPQPLHYQVHNITEPQLMVLEWRYTKDAANSIGADNVRIGNIMISAQP